MSRVLVGVKRVIDYAVKVSEFMECKGYLLLFCTPFEKITNVCSSYGLETVFMGMLKHYKLFVFIL